MPQQDPLYITCGGQQHLQPLEKEVLVLDSCSHMHTRSLIHPGRLASEHRASASGSGATRGCLRESYLRPTRNPSEDILLVNMGITISCRQAAQAFPASEFLMRGRRGVNSTKGFAPTTVHTMFNHCSARSLPHLTDCTADAPEEWRKFDSGPCDDCLFGKELRQGAHSNHTRNRIELSNRHTGKRGDAVGTFVLGAGHLVSEYPSRTGRADQQRLLDFHANGSKEAQHVLYLLKSGHEA